MQMTGRIKGLIACLQNEVDIPILMTGVMVLVILLPVVPVGIEGHLQDVFDIFARIAALITKKPGLIYFPSKLRRPSIQLKAA